jgi:transposase-like protein
MSNGKVTAIKRHLKFDVILLSRILELYANGQTRSNMASLLGIHRQTLLRWIKKHNIEQEFDRIDYELSTSAIKRGLLSRAEGSETRQVITEYLVEREDGVMVKTTETIRKEAPCAKAIQILARQYASTFSDLKDSDTVSDAKQILGAINYSAMSLRELQLTPSVLGSIVDASCEEVESIDGDDSIEAPPQGSSE